MLALARRADELLSADATERERFFANLALGTAMIYADEGEEGPRLLRDAVAILEASDALSAEPRSLAAAALAPLWLRERGAGTQLIDRAIEAARREGALGALPFALALAGRDAATSDRWAVGRSLYEEAIALARETDQALPLSAALAWLASVHARQGDGPACEAAGREALELTERLGLWHFHIWALDALADLELGLGRLDSAIERLEQKQRTLTEHTLTDPDLSSIPELVEAGVRGGGGGAGATAVDAFAQAAERKGQPWALARLERTRGLLAERFEPHFDEALRLHGEARDRFEEARTQLCFGERLRRSGQRVKARDQLRAAFEAFDELGAAPWGERARAELLATGEHARRRDPSSLDELTPQELQIGMLLAGDNTTREAAAKLFLSPKTVEYHLRNVYRKLGIHSREELTRELAGSND
jgi:DNA-binding CsgD family transcriptional regulator